MEIEEQVQELQDQELPLAAEQVRAEAPLWAVNQVLGDLMVEEKALVEAQALEQEQVEALLVRARGQLLALEARVQALAGLLEQVQAEVEDLAEALQQEALVEEQEEEQAEEQVVVQVLQLVQAAPQEVGLEQALAQELAETEDLKVLPLLSLYQPQK